MSDAKPPIAVLDNRAATYTKLHRLKPALRDGKQMIEEEKHNCIGYLRTGKILQLMENPSTALSIYHLGLRRVPSSDPNAKLLQGLRDKLAKQCAPPKAVDPLQALPIEILEYIICYLEFRETVNMLRVSKLWQTLVTSMPKVWSNLDFSTTQRNVTFTSARKYVKNARGMCSAVCFNNFGRYQQNILAYVASRCKGLREVRLSSGLVGSSFLKAVPYAVNLESLIVSSQCEITTDAVAQVFNQCVNLERAEFHKVLALGSASVTTSLAKLHTLVMNAASTSKTLPGLDNLLVNIENIRSLTLRNWDLGWQSPSTVDFSCLRCLEYLDLMNVRSYTTPSLPISIRSLDLSAYTIISFRELPFLPNLVDLSASPTFFCQMSMLMRTLAANKGEQRSLDICALHATFQDFTALISGGYLAKVESLKLKNAPISDEIAMLLAKYLSQLRLLDLACTAISGVGVKSLVIELKGKLEWLGLDECTRTSIDAVELARSMGVKVSYRFPDPKGSKKVRGQF